MGDIGPTLQNARTRAGLDIAEIETATKIRAKYLRALEQEDWNQLPGPTYVRSFLRTYADTLGLDGRMMVEQYRVKYERPSDQDLMPITPPRREGAGGDYRPPRWLIVVVLVALLVAALWWLGSRGDDGSSEHPQPATGSSSVKNRTTTATKGTTAAKKVRLQVRATGTVFVCVQDARGRILVDGRTMDSGDRSATMRSEAFRVRLGNGNAVLMVNGKSRRVGQASPQAWRVSPKSTRAIAIDRSPSCSPG